MTDHTNLCKRLRNLYVHNGTDYVQEAADAIESQNRTIFSISEANDMLLARAEKAEADNAALRAELDELAGQLALTVKELFDTEDRAEAAEAENAALRQDAERYRWLRRRNDEVAGGVAANIRVKYRCVESELDAAIDAALLAGKKP